VATHTCSDAEARFRDVLSASWRQFTLLDCPAPLGHLRAMALARDFGGRSFCRRTSLDASLSISATPRVRPSPLISSFVNIKYCRSFSMVLMRECFDRLNATLRLTADVYTFGRIPGDGDTKPAGTGFLYSACTCSAAGNYKPVRSDISTLIHMGDPAAARYLPGRYGDPQRACFAPVTRLNIGRTEAQFYRSQSLTAEMATSCPRSSPRPQGIRMEPRGQPAVFVCFRCKCRRNPKRQLTSFARLYPGVQPKSGEPNKCLSL
jgi:hypothetical protein